MSKKFRTEKDSLGEYPVPGEAWYGIQTARAVENFPVSGRRPDRDFHGPGADQAAGRYFERNG